MKLPCGCDIEGTSFCAVGGTLQMCLDHEVSKERSARALLDVDLQARALDLIAVIRKAITLHRVDEL